MSAPTLINAETGEIISTCTPDEARELTDRIKTSVEVAWHLIVEAYKSRAWAALGYSSWDDYTTREFGTARLGLPREERQEVVASLRDAGLSQRAIAAATGASQATVQRDLEAGDSYESPDDEQEFVDQHGVEPDEAEAALSMADPQAALDAMRDALVSKSKPQSEPKVTGTDGKSYPAKTKTPKERKRSSLPEAALKAGVEFRKAVERVERIVADDRLAANKEQVAAHLNGHLSYAIEVCQDLLNSLEESANAQQ